MSDADDITSETWWRREIVTTELDEACDAIAAGLRIPRGDVGTKGNVRHLRGHHRSQEWIKESDYCTNRSYTVQAGISEDQARHIAGIDITPGEWGTAENRRRVAAITARLVAAMRAGELDEVFEVYGAASDLTSVTGYNNRENRAASSDSSHLDHVHVGMDRRKLRDRAALGRLVAVILGDDMYEQQDRNVDWSTTNRTKGMLSMAPVVQYQIPGEKEPRREPNELATAVTGIRTDLTALAAKVAALPKPLPVQVDVATLKAALLDPEVLAAIAKAVVDEDHRRSAN